MVAGAEYRIGEPGPGDEAAVRELLAELALEESAADGGVPLTRSRAEMAHRSVRRHFVGENRLLIARDRRGRAVGMVWCVLYDPGTGLEGELAELYVRPGARRQGVATELARRAMEIFRAGGVTLASVWTQESNAGAMAAYRRAGFRPTDHTVLTWSPADGGYEPG